MAPVNAPTPFNLPQALHQALTCHRQGQLPRAEQLYRDILARQPDQFDAQHMLGRIALQRGDAAGALSLFEGALRTKPKAVDALLDYAAAVDVLDRGDEALAALECVLAIRPRSVEAHNNRATILAKLGRDAEALASLQEALAIKPDSADLTYNRGCVLSKLGRHTDALVDFDRALALRPDDARFHTNRGTALKELKRFDEALAACDRALTLAPDSIEAHNNRGNVLEKLGRAEEALASYDLALARNPDHADILSNRAGALTALGRHREAFVSCSRAAALKPDFVNAHWNEALIRLRLGDLAGGFAKYEWRWRRPQNADKQRVFSQAFWRGETDVGGKTILLHHEQGLGDTIQFARYAPLLAKQGARVILEVQPPLTSLLTTIDDGVEVIARGEALPAFDLHCPLASLPLAFQTELATIPADIPYIGAPPDRIAKWSDRLPLRRGRRIGLVWSGNAMHERDIERSIALMQMTPLLDAPGCQFVSLQHELRAGDAQILAVEPRIARLAPQFDDFADAAAVVAELDLVIAVDTSVAHLAGALGTPVWIMLPFVPDWRWLLDRNDSPWYPTARLFRQSRAGDWDSVINAVKRELFLLLRENAAGNGVPNRTKFEPNKT